MERLVVHFIRVLFDRMPYVVGRLSLLLFSWGHVRCESWTPVLWLSDIFNLGWTDRDRYGEIMLTSSGVRWAGYAVMITALISFVFVGLLVLSKI